MSELYAITVEKVAAPHLELRVTTVHPDAGPPPTDRSFPLNLLIDLWDLHERGFSVLIGGITRLGDAESKALARRPPWGPAFHQLRDLSRGVQLPISQDEYDRLKPGTTTWKGQPICGWGFGEGVYSVHLRSDEDAFRREADQVVVAYTQDQLEHQDAYRSWPEDDQLPRARLVVELADGALLGFVRAGMSFDTASYF